MVLLRVPWKTQVTVVFAGRDFPCPATFLKEDFKMGLDMYLYRIKKANVEANKFYKREELDGNVSVFGISLEDAKSEDSIKEIVEYLTPIKMEARLLKQLAWGVLFSTPCAHRLFAKYSRSTQ